MPTKIPSKTPVKKLEKKTEAKNQSPDLNRSVQELILTIDALRLILMDETEALQKSDIKAFTKLQDHKIALARAYQLQNTDLMAQKDQLKLKVHPELRKQLRQKEHEFSLVTRINLEWLDRMRRCTERLGTRIIEAARDHASKDRKAYGARGKIEPRERRVSLSLNESA